MNVLLTNDDGINAPGLAALNAAVSQVADTTIVAPASEMSAVGHAITIGNPLRIKEIEKNGDFFGYAIEGTPADCVKIAYWAMLKDKPKPDVVISGINHGSNTGINTIYSGTVSAATEAAILGIPSFAVSLTTYGKPDFSLAAEFAAEFLPTFKTLDIPRGTLLNINIPAVPRNQISGVRVTRQGMAVYKEEFHIAEDPYKRKYYWLKGEKVDIEKDTSVDDGAIAENYISITPIHFNLTHEPLFESLQSLNKNGF